MEIKFDKEKEAEVEKECEFSMEVLSFRLALRAAAAQADDPMAEAICELYECFLDAGCPVSVIQEAMLLFEERHSEG